jgi:hypothetical protein
MTPKAKSKGMVVQEIGGELLVYDLERNEAHCLNALTSFVWQHADGSVNAARLVELARERGVDGVDDAGIGAALASLSDAHLLDEPMREVPEADLSRRQMIRQVAAVGGVAATVAIASIVAPTPAEAKTKPGGSCGPTVQDCQGDQN